MIETNTKLPRNVVPQRYVLTLEPDLKAHRFEGSETVEVEIVEPTSEITLNSAELEVLSCTLIGAGLEVRPRDISFKVDAETVTFSFDSPLPAGPATLAIEFSGELNDKLRGFYLSSYTTLDGQTQDLATTQFESTDARRAFPCWDEPSIKATFDVTLVVDAGLVAVSNMEIVSNTETLAGKRAFHFAPTPVMSTYLLAFVVGDLASIEDRADDGTLIRIWATRGNEEKGRFALETSIALLTYFNEYFGIPYPLSKLDHLAIPDFAAGAMENWGAITYRETALLVDPEQSSAGTREVVASIISHEMAHMWFGDLVTMAWWDDLWLNESFASWMGDKAVDQLHPEWDMWTQFLTNDTMVALNLDGLANSHPIEQKVGNPAEIGQLFDAISYSKGGSILRMLEQFLGPDDFQKGLQIYLERHKYGNARTHDLWDALSQASAQPVAEIMDTWTTQTGYPVVEVSVTRGTTKAEVCLSQQRFLYEDLLGHRNGGRELWKVPIGVRAASDPEPVRTLMHGRETTVRIKNSADGPEDDWIKVNPGHTGFYRVKYPPGELERLTHPIRILTLPASDRLGIQGDAYALAKGGHIEATQFLSVAEAYSNETDPSVCGDLAANLNSLDNLLANEIFHPGFQDFARGIFRPISQRIGWDASPGQGHRDTLLRSTTLQELGHFEDEDTLAEARRRFEAYVNDPASLHPDTRAVTFSMAAQRGDSAMYDLMWELESNATLHEEKNRFLYALASFSHEDLLQQTLDRSLTSDVRSQDTIRVVVSVAVNRHGRKLAWEFLKDNWDEFDRRYGKGGHGLMRLVGMTSMFTTEEQRQDVERFFVDHSAPAAERTIRQSLERVRLNIVWLERNREELAAWLAAR